MFTANVETKTIRQIETKVDTIVQNIRDRSRKLLSSCNTYEEACSKLDEYITTCCSSEVRSMSSSMYFDLYSQISQSRLFSNPELVNEFYAIDMRNYLNENCQFQLSERFSYSPKDRQKLAIGVGGGIAVVGTAVSLGLILPLGIVPSVVVGALAYPLTFKTVEKKNVEDYLVTVDLYLKRLKDSFMLWVQQFEEYYSNTVDDIICKVNLR
jgi:hypothetical protein